MKKYGCIGNPLKHSFSREIHGMLAEYEYELMELLEKEVVELLEKKEFTAINVTIPYKQTVIPYLDTVSPVAQRIGAVNTIVNKDGKLFGYNTDYYGMKALIERMGLSLANKKVLVLGTGGTGKTAVAVAQDMGALEIHTVSRRKEGDHITYEDAISCYNDAQIIINTTPVGMYPKCSGVPVQISSFPNLEGVVDAVYNPICTDLVLDAREKGIKAEGGLYMLVCQAIYAVERFLDTKIAEGVAEIVYKTVLQEKQNIVLTGMPGCGKSTVGKLLDIDGYEYFDTDKEIEKRCGCTIKELISQKGEAYFRDLESLVIQEISSVGCRIISTGGGAVLREENVRSLKHNGVLFFIDAPLSSLVATSDRPLSDTEEKLCRLYEERIGIYKSTADVIVPYMETPTEEALYIMEKRRELL